MKNLTDNIIVNKSFDFALGIIKYTTLLENNKQYVIARQLLKSGTSVGANIFEAQGAESKADFIHKLKISEKEINETQYWLMLCKHSKHYPETGLLLSQLEELRKILGKIISTSKNNQNSLKTLFQALAFWH